MAHAGHVVESPALATPDLGIFARQGKWKHGSTGRVCESLLKQELFEPGEESLAMMCGPPGMQDACKGVLQSWGYSVEQIIVF